jgi:hypothetical protein
MVNTILETEETDFVECLRVTCQHCFTEMRALTVTFGETRGRPLRKIHNTKCPGCDLNWKFTPIGNGNYEMRKGQ